MAVRTVLLQNMVNKTIGLNKPEYGIKVKWTKKGQCIPLPFDTVQQMIFDEGFYRMLENGYLYINDMKDKIDLGLEPAGATESENIKVLSDEKIESLLKKLPFSVFKRELANYNKTQIESLINYAIVNECLDAEKSDYLKELTGIDILKAVSLNRDLAKADKK